ncbi:MAG TPA: hypothetical protein VFM14_15260 [Gemmatimonadales bacterium]|nr:hypothetical protein [Gemmatimonadales bacterium]
MAAGSRGPEWQLDTPSFAPHVVTDETLCQAVVDSFNARISWAPPRARVTLYWLTPTRYGLVHRGRNQSYTVLDTAFQSLGGQVELD